MNNTPALRLPAQKYKITIPVSDSRLLLEALPETLPGGGDTPTLPPGYVPPPTHPDVPQVSYYLYDHLGSLRIRYHTVWDCQTNTVYYRPEHVADYYPFFEGHRS